MTDPLTETIRAAYLDDYVNGEMSNDGQHIDNTMTKKLTTNSPSE